MIPDRKERFNEVSLEDVGYLRKGSFLREIVVPARQRSVDEADSDEAPRLGSSRVTLMRPPQLDVNLSNQDSQESQGDLAGQETVTPMYLSRIARAVLPSSGSVRR